MFSKSSSRQMFPALDTFFCWKVAYNVSYFRSRQHQTNLNRLHPQEGVFHPLESITDFLELRLTLDIRPSFATTAPGSLCVEKGTMHTDGVQSTPPRKFSSNTDLWGISVSGNSFTTETCITTIGSRLSFGKRMADEWWGKKSFALGGTAFRESQVETSGRKPIVRFS